MPARPSTGDQPEEERMPMLLVIDLDLLPNDPAEEVRRVLGFWTAWLPKMDLSRTTEQELHDFTRRAVGVPRLIGANATGRPEATR